LVADGFHVLAVDLPGFGDSALPDQGVDVDALIEPLHAAWQMLRASEKVSFIGFSFGGMAAALWLAAYPQDATNLILVGSPGLGIKSPHRVPLKGWRHLPTEDMQIEAHRHNLLGLMLHDESKLDELAMAVHRLNVARDRTRPNAAQASIGHTHRGGRSAAHCVSCACHLWRVGCALPRVHV
ncbi:MAG: 2-hydroxy-6-oxononadienedioate/2-hydroxy-6-oxononatrienedioate hydrolase, partial [Pseudomonadota bacterium]